MKSKYLILVVMVSIALLICLVSSIAFAFLNMDDANEQNNNDSQTQENKSNRDMMGQSPDDSTIGSDSEDMDEDATSRPGSYSDYDESRISDDLSNVIFFHAEWCPICVGIEESINENLQNIPPDVQILKADFDTATELREQYGVSRQYTFVQVDGDGNELKQWNTSFDFDDVISEIE